MFFIEAKLQTLLARKLGLLLEVECELSWREARFEVKLWKVLHVRTTFGRLHVISRGRWKDCAPCQKWAKREGFVTFPKSIAGVRHLKRICKDACSVAGAVQETCSSEMLRQRGVAFWSIRSSGFARWFRLTGAALCMTWHHFFLAGKVRNLRPNIFPSFSFLHSFHHCSNCFLTRSYRRCRTWLDHLHAFYQC